MWYRDISENLPQAVATIAHYFDSDALTSDTILERCSLAHKRGLAGEPIHQTFKHRDEYHDVRTLAKTIEAFGHFPDVDPSELARLIYDAWADGVQEKDRVDVRLVPTESQCPCGSTEYDIELRAWGPTMHDAAVCNECGEWFPLSYYAEVHDPYAHQWADNDQCIDGSSWETASDMPGFAYTILTDRPSLVEELRAEGYSLDLSEY